MNGIARMENEMEIYGKGVKDMLLDLVLAQAWFIWEFEKVMRANKASTVRLRPEDESWIR